VQQRISYYDIHWDRRERSGRLWLTFDDRTRTELASLSMDELALLCSILRIGKTVFYDAERDTLSTEADPVGKDA
jgi:hypothetical protein